MPRKQKGKSSEERNATTQAESKEICRGQRKGEGIEREKEAIATSVRGRGGKGV